MTESRGSSPGKRLTIWDVAAEAGVSVSTVSKALNRSGRVSPATREHVEAVAKRLNFQPNRLAQGLISGRTGTVGLLTNDLEGRFSLPILMGAEDALGAGKLSVLLCDARGDAIREQYHLTALIGRRVDGLIVVSDNANPRRSLGRIMPVPVVYAYGPSTDKADISVVTDNVNAGHIGAQRLLDTGRRRIAYIGGEESLAAARDRADGARQALAEAGLDFATVPVFGPWSEEWGRHAARLLLERDANIDAIMCGSDQIARGVIDSLREAHIAIPDRIAVLGHDNWEALAAHSQPPLTTIDMNLQELGHTAAQLLFRALDGDRQPGPHVIRGRVVVRGSTL